MVLYYFNDEIQIRVICGTKICQRQDLSFFYFLIDFELRLLVSMLLKTINLKFHRTIFNFTI